METTFLYSAQRLIGRLLPDHAGQFAVTEICPENGRDVFEIDNGDEGIMLRGTSGVGIASALHWYLKYVCNCPMSGEKRWPHWAGRSI